MRRDIFVFGSNLAGIHGAGSAKAALDLYGAIWGKGVGIQGNSYGIPTKDGNFFILPLPIIQAYVNDFNDYARSHSELYFRVVAIGCGLAGYKPEQIAPFFVDTPMNCELPPEFVKVLTNEN